MMTPAILRRMLLAVVVLSFAGLLAAEGSAVAAAFPSVPVIQARL